MLVFVDFFYELRNRGVKVGLAEAVSMAQALSLDLHETSLDGFYEVARALCVHREQDLDNFDTAFAVYFKGLEFEAVKLTEELLAWLENPVDKRELSDEERALLEKLDLAEVRRLMKERIEQQRGRHDKGNRWIGTGGTSPFGRGGTNPGGVAVGKGTGARGAMARAEAHDFRPLRGDIVLDVRQIEIALRRLRAFTREGAEMELDIEESIRETAKNAGELEVVLRPERRPSVRVLLLLDVGGSMDPHIELCERLFSAAQRATHWKKLETYYFHNCIYKKVYKTTALRDGVLVDDLLKQCDASWRLVVVGDALMHPTELLSPGWGEELPGIVWLDRIWRHFRKSVWLNPEPERMWYGTAQAIRRVFPMYRLSLDGLSQAMKHLADRTHK